MYIHGAPTSPDESAAGDEATAVEATACENSMATALHCAVASAASLGAGLSRNTVEGTTVPGKTLKDVLLSFGRWSLLHGICHGLLKILVLFARFVNFALCT